MPVGLDIRDEQLRVAMQSGSHLKRFLKASGREWLVLNALDLTDALPWPDGVELVQQAVSAYRDHRRVIPSGWTERVQQAGQVHEVPVYRGEQLSLDEIGQVRLWLDELEARVRADLKARNAVQVSP